VGYKITPQGIPISEDGIQGVLDAPRPTNESEVRGLIGGLAMLRRFDPRIAEKTLVLNPLTNSFRWESEENSKLEELKHLLREIMKNPKDMRPSPELPLIFETDASKRAVGASLVQEITAKGGSKEKALIHAASRSFNAAETRYFTIRRELFCHAEVQMVLDWKGFRDQDGSPSACGILQKAFTLNRERGSS
jgi:hypothetical protein